MALTLIIQAALLLLLPIHTVAHLHPRQYKLNETATPTFNPSQVTPPPCCWIVIGEFAVGYNNWYSSTGEQVVGMQVKPPDSSQKANEVTSHCCKDLYPQVQWHRDSRRLHHNSQIPVGSSRDGYIPHRRLVRALSNRRSHRSAHWKLRRGRLCGNLYRQCDCSDLPKHRSCDHATNAIRHLDENRHLHRNTKRILASVQRLQRLAR